MVNVCYSAPYAGASPFRARLTAARRLAAPLPRSTFPRRHRTCRPRCHCCFRRLHRRKYHYHHPSHHRTRRDRENKFFPADAPTMPTHRAAADDLAQTQAQNYCGCGLWSRPRRILSGYHRRRLALFVPSEVRSERVKSIVLFQRSFLVQLNIQCTRSV